MPVRDAASLRYRPDIDGLRALAVMLVIAYHAFPRFKTGGFVGVDVFFVISGYLITQLILVGTRRQQFSLTDFYRRRVRRIVPALVLVTAASTLVAWYLLLPGELQWFGRSLAWCSAFLANIFFATTGGYFARAADLNPLLHLWSLGVEEQFYLAWPLFIMLIAKMGVIKRALALSIVASLAISVWGAWHSPSQYFYYPHSRGWELACGGLLGTRQLEPKHKFISAAASNACSLIGLLLILAGGIFWSPGMPIPGLWSLLPVSGAALLLGAEGAILNCWLLAARPLVFVGRISYPLYLWHWPIFAFTRIVSGHALTPVTALTEVAVAFAAAYATYRWLELPVRSARVGRAAIFTLLAGLACMALIGYGIGTRKISGRLSGPTAAAWDDAVRDWHFPSSFTSSQPFSVATLSTQRPVKALFIGDSHLEQYWPRVEWAVRTHMPSARSVAFVTRSGCPPLPGIDVRGRGHNCNKHFDFAVAQAFQDDVDTVVFGAFWEDYFLGEFSADKRPPAVYRVDDERQAILALDLIGTQRTFDEFRRLVAKLVSSGRRVFIVLSNPTSPQFDPLLPPRLRLSLHNPERADLGPGAVVDCRPFEAFVAPLMDRLRKLAASSGAHVIDPRDDLCDGFLCHATDEDGLPRYIDTNHLRGAVARAHAAFMDETVLGPPTRPLPQADSTPGPLLK
jgi:peptidoglycan/LPS O-acetylase OafA/YrhL